MAATHKPKPQIPADHPGPLQVIALGLPRCATSTLKEAFESPSLLAVGPCMHMSRCLPDPPIMKLVHDALKEKDKYTRQLLLHRLFSGCAATADFPGHLFVEDLTEMYPAARFILNVRKDGAQGWAKSMQESIAGFFGWGYRVACYWSYPDWLHYRTEVAWNEFVRERFGVENFYAAEAYERHNAWVRGVLEEKGREYLVWEPGMGWDELCGFLGKAVPKEPLPRRNERAAMKKVVSWRIALGLRLWMRNMALPIALTAACAFLASRTA